MRFRGATFAGIIITMGIAGLIWEKYFSVPRSRPTGSLYGFTIRALDGTPVNFEQYRNKDLLIVNTASKCGYTPQYAELQKLHELYGERLIVLGFPSNDFLWQEPGSNEEIAAFCSKNYGVTFQMFEKISVRGRHQHPLYQWLAEKSGHRPAWNFSKYFVNRKGEVTGFYGPKVSPLDPSIVNQIDP